MNITTTLKLSMASVCLLTSLSSFAGARQPILCSQKKSTSTQNSAYEQVVFSGLIDQSKESINFNLSVSNKEGRDEFREKSEKAYQVEDNNIVIETTYKDESSELKISKDILTTFSKVRGTWKNRVLECSVLPLRLVKVSHPEFFENFNIEMATDVQTRIKTKNWTSSDGKFSLYSELYPASPKTKRYPGFGPHSRTTVTINGLVIDELEDLPGHLSYMLYGDNEKIIEARITNPSDVAMLTKIFKSKQSTLELVHPYGESSKVKVRIDCISLTECMITASK